MTWKIPLFKSYWEEDDVDSVAKVIRRGSYWAAGPEIEKFENKISNFLGTSYCVSFNSGTSALHSVLLAHGITSGEVIVPSFTFIATPNSVLLSGAKPIFAEIESETYGLDIEDVKKRINKKTRAVIPIHYGGLACKDIKAIKEITEDYNILLIEDAAESLGSKIDGDMVGTFGHSAMFSFCQNKVITTGEGGVIVTNSRDMYEKMKLIRSHGREEKKSDDYFSTTKNMDYIQIGHNFRMSTMSAALGLSQIKKINKIIKMRRENAEYLNERLSKIPEIKIPQKTKNQYHVYQMYTIQLENNKDREKLQNYLTKKGIMTKVYFEPVHLKSFYKERLRCKEGDLPKTEEISKKVLTIPLYPSLLHTEMDYIVDNIKNCCE